MEILFTMDDVLLVQLFELEQIAPLRMGRKKALGGGVESLKTRFAAP